MCLNKSLQILLHRKCLFLQYIFFFKNNIYFIFFKTLDGQGFLLLKRFCYANGLTSLVLTKFFIRRLFDKNFKFLFGATFVVGLKKMEDLECLLKFLVDKNLKLPFFLNFKNFFLN